jgi:hypothetical protein
VPPQPSSDSSDQVRDILVEAARTQLAAVTAATRFWAGWAEVADKYAQGVSDELARLEAGPDSGDLVGRLSDLTREYLREMSELPGASVKHFNTQLEGIGKPKPKRTRAARAKD